ncbi:SAM-dependent methyltransferase [Rhodococcus spelaei]|uniref:S-adenosyl-L-methionine-dependent methyltransferase n=1 Tax=Rhodococcus spelaei TaxID=2546320 RepID=A0A541B8K3_9NOCA|nr:SAM-dependent methyltransferase [Rhodococcus spelaei]TQF68641.1 SAM-dependent methyltransferase [Rhodococcus spelaei]
MSAPEGVGGTALAVARARAAETARPDRLFADPLAAVFLDAAGTTDTRDRTTMDPDAVRAVVAMYHWIVARTLFLDAVASTAVRDGIGQVVVLGAGLDTRGFRLGWPATLALFEVDRSDVFSFKESALCAVGAEPTCRRRTVVVDLRDEWVPALAEAGFDPTTPTLWIAEGLLAYLEADQVERLLGAVTAASAPGSRVAVTALRIEGEVTVAPTATDPFADIRGLWKRPGPVDVVDRLAAHGWRVEVSYPRELLVEAGRIEAAEAPGVAGPRLIQAVRQA